jgi:uncharacterized cupin superfamily protein
MPAISPPQFVAEDRAPDDICGPARALWISEAAGLTQFGAFVEVLEPGSRSALVHWHEAEDELVLVLEGEITLVEGDRETLLRPGEAAAFRAGVPVAHCLLNRSDRPTRCLVVGTRAPLDRIVYPGHDRICVRDRSQPDDVWTDLAGRPASNPYG